MNDVTIFRQGGAVSGVQRQPTALGKTLASSNLTYRRIQTNVNGTFKRLVNGEQIGQAVRGDINVIIVGALPQVSRVYYREKYDPNREATLPNCWSNLGDRPEQEASDAQATTCAACPQNIKGSGDNGGRACRYQRRVAILLEGDMTGEIYQFNIPAKSLFGKGVGNVHPFESYVRFLQANNEDPDTVVTNISYDPDAESMELRFTPQRTLTDDEYALVLQAQAHPDANRYTVLTVAAADKVAKAPAHTNGASAQAAPDAAQAPAPAPEKPKIVSSDEPGDAEETAPAQPEVRQAKAEVATPEGKKSLKSAIEEWTGS